MALQSNPFSGSNASSSTTKLFNRVGHVELDFGSDSASGQSGKLISFKGLDFKFRVSKVCPDYPKGFAEVSILGLSQETMNRITELTTMDQAMSHKKRVRVFAGYAKDNDPDYDGELICDMDIVYATPTTMPPEVWLTVTAGIRIQDKYESISIDLPDRQSIKEKIVTRRNIGFDFMKEIYPLKNFCKDIVRIVNEEYKKMAEGNGGSTYELELDFQADDYEDMNITQFNHSGTVSELIKKLNDLDPQKMLKFYIDNRKDEKKDFLVVKAKAAVDESGNSGQKMKTTNLQYLDVKHGLIGLPSLVQGNNLRCRSLLSPNLKMLDWVKMESTIIPKMNGYWQINEVTHNGHFRGNEWYTDIVAFDPTKCQMQGTAGMVMANE